MGGLGEVKVKRVARQLCSALEFLHEEGFVHFDVCLQNIFVFHHGMCLVKLGDFGNAHRVGALVKKRSVRLAWAPPEVYQALHCGGYLLQTSHDAWQLGILIFVCVTGSYPWFSPDVADHHYNSWVSWLEHRTPKVPPRFRCFTPCLLRLLQGLLEPHPEKRASVALVLEYMPQTWLVRGINPLDIDFDERSFFSEILVARPKS
ncbi:serine/threonine-protein kinase SBK1-like [Panulirus ornatus]|uniref:serine/threonine-protein kinase SBK1-like n=1 Tax=Panulirus ornatus TaxID=150431 RepID=UPI003A857379